MGDPDFGDDAVFHGAQGVFHFHGFEDEERIAGVHPVAHGDAQFDHLARHLGHETAGRFLAAGQDEAGLFHERDVAARSVDDEPVAAAPDPGPRASPVDFRVDPVCVAGVDATECAIGETETAVALGAVTHGDARFPVVEDEFLLGQAGVAPPRRGEAEHLGVAPVFPLHPERREPREPGAFCVARRVGPRRIHPGDEVRGGVAGQELGGAEGGDEEVAVGRDAAEVRSLEAQGETAGCLGTGGGVGDDFGEHRVEIRPNDGALGHTRVPAQRRCFGGREGRERAGGGQEFVRRVFRVEARFDGGAGEADVALHVAQWLAGGDAQLLADEVDARREFGDRVFDLEARVGFEKEEFARVFVEEELDGAGRAVGECPGQAQSGLSHGFAQGDIDPGRRRLLDDLLVAPLDRALAFAQVDEVAVGVAEHLDLDVPRPPDIALEKDPVVAEAALGLPAGGRQRFVEVGRRFDDAHALAPAARRRFHQQRVADAVRRSGVVRTGQGRHLGFFGQGPGGDLVAHLFDGLGRRPHPRQTRGDHLCSEGRVLREEPVARVDGAGPGGPGGCEDRAAVEVAGLESHGFVGIAHEGGTGVGVDVDRHAADAHVVGAADDAARDLSAIGDEEGGEAHRRNTP